MARGDSIFAPDQDPAQPEKRPLAGTLLWTMTVASAAAVANIYYNQPLLAEMMRAFHASPHAIGLVATFTQVGYALGLPVFVPFGDFVERRRLVVLLFLAEGCSLIAAALAQNLIWFIVASLFVGFTSIIPQIMIPLAAELTTPEEQGRTIGRILSGILLGILLARTVSGMLGGYLGWRVIYWAAAVMALVFACLLRVQLPPAPGHAGIVYRELMQSIWRLAREVPKLRQVSLVAAMFFACFTAFWTTLVFLLETPPYHYGSQAAGLFGLVGAAGVAVAPIAGRLADQRSPRFVVGIAIFVVLAAFGIFWLFGFHLWGLVLGVVLLDAGVQAAQVANQSRVFRLLPHARNRANTVYMISYFGGGSLGSLFGSWSWSHWHWHGVCAIGVALILIAGGAFLWRGPEAETAVADERLAG